MSRNSRTSGNRCAAKRRLEQLERAQRSPPRAATGSVPMISSPRTITISSTMLTTTQTWLGTMRTTSPTLGRAPAA